MDPTTFEIIYYNEGIKYAYGFSFDKDKIINEYLYHWPNGREALVFSREEEKYEFRESVQEQMTLFLKEMMFADLGICNVELSGTRENPIISTVHQRIDDSGKQNQYTLLLEQESVGTQRFFSRIGLWIDAIDSGAVLVVDEIEASMHPLLTRHLIEMIQDQIINQNHAQLIFTTHDTGLLDLNIRLLFPIRLLRSGFYCISIIR